MNIPTPEPCDVIICTYGKSAWTLQSIQALTATAPVGRIKLVDCSSQIPSWTHERLRAHPLVDYIPVENIGCNRAYNLAWRATETRYVIFACSDSIFLPGWFEAAWQAMHGLNLTWVSPKWENVECFAPRLAWAAIGNLDRNACAVGEFCGCSALMDWHHLRDTVGYYDERFFICFGDDDLRYRMDAAGVRYGVTYPARMMHISTASRQPLTAEQNVILESWDEEEFHDKYRDRPDILARHPRLGPMDERIRMWRERGLT